MDQGQCQAQGFGISGATLLQTAIVFNSCMRGKGWELRSAEPTAAQTTATLQQPCMIGNVPCTTANIGHTGPGVASAPQATRSDINSSASAGAILIPVRREGGTYVVPVLVNKAITLNFVIDSGAADVSIPADVVLTLVRTGTVQRSDFIGTQTYKLADGSTVPSTTFRIQSLTMNNVVIDNVRASIAPVAGELLLGQSFLNRFKSWSIDNARQALVLTR
jgi:hypothetical protein